MTEVSARLRAARERSGRTIEEISASTKIRAATLAALERGDFARLPGDFYTRALLRTYARELGLPPHSLIEEYEASRMPVEPPAGELRGTVTAAAPVAHERARVWPRIAAIAGNSGVVIALVVVLLAVAVVRSRPAATRTPEAGAVGTTGATAAVPPAATPAAPQAQADELTIEIQAAAPIWVTGAADGKRVLYRLLAPGERVKVEARRDVAFRVGDAAAFTYSINGAPAKPLGGPGEVRDVQITRDNYRTFLR